MNVSDALIVVAIQLLKRGTLHLLPYICEVPEECLAQLTQEDVLQKQLTVGIILRNNHVVAVITDVDRLAGSSLRVDSR